MLLGDTDVVNDVAVPCSDQMVKEMVPSADQMVKEILSTSDTIEAQLSVMRNNIELSKLNTEMAERQYDALQASFEQSRAQMAESLAFLKQTQAFVEQSSTELSAQLSLQIATPPVVAANVAEVAPVVAANVAEAASAPVVAARDATETAAAPLQLIIPSATEASSAPVVMPDALPDASVAAVDAAVDAAVSAVQGVAEAAVGAGAIVVDPAYTAQQAAQLPAGPDTTPVLLVMATAGIIYRWSEGVKALPKVSGEPAGTKVPNFASLATAASKGSTATDGARNAWEIFTAGIVNLQAADFEGWKNGPPSPLYSNAPASTTQDVGSSIPSTSSSTAPASSATPTASAEPVSSARSAPRMGAKELAKAAARASGAIATTDYTINVQSTGAAPLSTKGKKVRKTKKALKLKGVVIPASKGGVVAADKPGSL